MPPTDPQSAAALLGDIAPAVYRPYASGHYHVRPGLFQLGHDFGNGAADGHAFQFDRDFPTYRSAKAAVRAADMSRCVLDHDLAPRVAAVITRWIADRLATEHPALFAVETDGERRSVHCRASDERLVIDERGRLLADASRCDLAPPPRSALDALAMNIAEDVAITRCDGGGRGEQRGGRRGDAGVNRLAALHVCLPGHWSPAEKIGLDFAQVHAPVPGMEAITTQQEAFVRQMIEARDGLVRFVWGVQRGSALDRHPDARTHVDAEPHGDDAYYLRIERQVIIGFADVDASLFLIRPYLSPLRDLRDRPDDAAALARAIAGMSPAAAAYKGLADDRARIVTLLESWS